jgi:hypothetical protein
MVKRKPESDNLLTVMARTVGSALGTVSYRVSNLAGSNSGGDGSRNPKPKGRKPKSANGSRDTLRPLKQSKRAKAKRKPTKKTTKVAHKSGGR